MDGSARLVALGLASLAWGCFGDKVLSQGGGGEGEGAAASSSGSSNGGGGSTSSTAGATSDGGHGGDDGGGAASTSQGGAGGDGGDGGAGGGCPVPRVFVTSMSYPGNFAVGQDDAWVYAQSLCDARALAGGLGSGWEPWLSVGQKGAIDELSGVGPWHLIDCVTSVATDKADLTDGNIAHGIDQDELGAVVSSDQEVWTGTQQNGTPFGNDCSGWKSTDLFFTGRRGKTNNEGLGWTSTANDACSNVRRLYCFEP